MRNIHPLIPMGLAIAVFGLILIFRISITVAIAALTAALSEFGNFFVPYFGALILVAGGLYLADLGWRYFTRH